MADNMTVDGIVLPYLIVAPASHAGQNAFATDIGFGDQQSPRVQKEPNRTRCRWADVVTKHLPVQ